jgi:hypothetical protein
MPTATLTQEEAVRRAKSKHKRLGKHYLVCHRNGQNEYGVFGYFVIAKDQKHAWAKDESLMFDTEWDQ